MASNRARFLWQTLDELRERRQIVEAQEGIIFRELRRLNEPGSLVVELPWSSRSAAPPSLPSPPPATPAPSSARPRSQQPPSARCRIIADIRREPRNPGSTESDVYRRLRVITGVELRQAIHQGHVSPSHTLREHRDAVILALQKRIARRADNEFGMNLYESDHMKIIHRIFNMVFNCKRTQWKQKTAADTSDTTLCA
ncbi:hypothetical protein BC940DRAFT_320005 [Gongronella butleri]|nr:hypothetical protein BC940DRAFT_320005 [Gongronella butleri]